MSAARGRKWYSAVALKSLRGEKFRRTERLAGKQV